MFLTEFGLYSIVVGIPWLQLHDVVLRCAYNTITFVPQYSPTHCHNAPVTVHAVTEELPQPVCHPQKATLLPQIRPQWPFRGNIIMLNGSLFLRTVKKGNLTVFKASLYDIDESIEEKDDKEGPLEEIVRIQYPELLPLFNQVLTDRLPLHRPGIDHDVCLKAGETPTWGPLYSVSRAKLAVPKEWLEENMSNGFIRQSLSPFAAPVLFAKKPDGGLQFCIDYHERNSKTIQNRYRLPEILETVNSLRGARLYTNLDVRGAYTLLQVEEGDEHELPVSTRYGLFEPMVMQFGTTNPRSDSQGYINNTIREALDDFASAYLDDKLIFGNSEEEHVEQLKWIMQRLLEVGLDLKPERCKFLLETMRFLALIISIQGI